MSEGRVAGAAEISQAADQVDKLMRGGYCSFFQGIRGSAEPRTKGIQAAKELVKRTLRCRVRPGGGNFARASGSARFKRTRPEAVRAGGQRLQP